MAAPSPRVSPFAPNPIPCVEASPSATSQVNSSVVVPVTDPPSSKVMSFSPESAASRSFSTGLPVTSTGWLNVTRARTSSPTL